MQVDTGADSTVISSKMWTELTKPQLDGKMRHLETYDGQQLTLLGLLTCDVEWNGSRLTQKQLGVVQSDKKFGLLGRDPLPKHGVKNVTTEHLPGVKSYKAHVKLISRSQPLQSRENTSTFSRQGHREAEIDGQTGHHSTGTAWRSH